MSQAMWETATSIVSFAKAAGLEITISDVYTEENSKEIALIASFMKAMAAKSGKCTIEVTNE